MVHTWCRVCMVLGIMHKPTHNEEFEKEAQTVDFKPQIVEISIAPKKASIAVKLAALAWVRG